MKRPRRLSPGDRVAVVAPAGPVPRERLAAGMARLDGRYLLTLDEALFSATGYLAGDDDRRATELQSAIDDPDVRAIFCARGGYGLMRLLPRLDLTSLARDPRPVVGFSDVTALHAACLRAGVSSLHGPTVGHLAALPDEHVAALVRLLESPEPPPPWRDLEPITGGRARGIAVGGNLELVTRLLGTPWALPTRGAVLFLEEIGERPYRIDRALTQLELAGARPAAVVVGDLVQCEQANAPAPADVVRERLSRWGVPVLAGAPFGHGPRNLAFALGSEVEVDAADRAVRFLEAAVA